MNSPMPPSIASGAGKTWCHRVCAPEDTLDRITPHLERMGVTRLADITGLDRVGIPVVQAIRPMGRSLSVAQGKGPDLASATASAAMEAAEGWHAEYLQLPSRRGTLKEVMGDFPFAGLPLQGKIDTDHPITFLAGWDLLTEAEAWLPADFVHKDYTHPPDMTCFCRSTNGLASGNTVSEALSAALHEVIERDALAEFAALPEHDRQKRRVDPRQIAALHPTIADLLGRIDAAGLSLFLSDMTTDLGVPAMRAHLGEVAGGTSGAGRPVPGLHIGSGCHLDPVTAAIRAITEAAQSRLTQIAGSRDDLADNCYVAAPFGNVVSILERAADRAAHGFRRFDYDDGSTSTPRGDVEELLALLQSAGLDRVLWADLSRDDLPIHVVRVLVPGLGFLKSDDTVLGTHHRRQRMT